MYKVIGVDNQVYGPVDADQVRQWIRERRLSPQSQLQKEGETEWRALSTFTEFAELLAAAAPPPASPGAPMPASSSYGAPPTSGTNGMAIAGFITGLLSFCCVFFGFAGLVFSGIALSQIAKNPGQGGRGLAMAGIVLSVIGLILAVLVFFLRPFDDLMKDFGR